MARSGLAVAFALGVLAFPGGAIGLAYAGLLPSTSAALPPAWEAALAGSALEASLDRRARRETGFAAATDAQAMQRGQAVYKENCSGCHGTRFAPSEWGSKGFYPRVPQFWQQPTDLKPEQVYVAVRDGIRYSGMASWRPLLTDEQMRDVAIFVTHMPPTGKAKAPAAPVAERRS